MGSLLTRLWFITGVSSPRLLLPPPAGGSQLREPAGLHQGLVLRHVSCLTAVLSASHRLLHRSCFCTLTSWWRKVEHLADDSHQELVENKTRATRSWILDFRSEQLFERISKDARHDASSPAASLKVTTKVSTKKKVHVSLWRIKCCLWLKTHWSCNVKLIRSDNWLIVSLFKLRSKTFAASSFLNVMI